jgi:hypothetical protein
MVARTIHLRKRSIALSASTIAEDASVGALVGTLSVTNGTGTYAYTMLFSSGGKFALDGADTTRVEVAAALDFETDNYYQIEVSGDNGVQAPLRGIFAITVTDVSEGAGQPIGILLALTKAA